MCAQLAAPPFHLCLSAARSIILIRSIWQPKPVKKTFLLATDFTGSDTGDSQPQEPHIIQSTVHEY